MKPPDTPGPSPHPPHPPILPIPILDQQHDRGGVRPPPGTRATPFCISQATQEVAFRSGPSQRILRAGRHGVPGTHPVRGFRIEAGEAGEAWEHRDRTFDVEVGRLRHYLALFKFQIHRRFGTSEKTSNRR